MKFYNVEKCLEALYNRAIVLSSDLEIKYNSKEKLNAAWRKVDNQGDTINTTYFQSIELIRKETGTVSLLRNKNVLKYFSTKRK